MEEVNNVKIRDGLIELIKALLNELEECDEILSAVDATDRFKQAMKLSRPYVNRDKLKEFERQYSTYMNNFSKVLEEID
jgi:hypothetical protein